MTIQRTQEEILKRIEERKEEDFFGFEISDYVHYLEFKYAQPYLNDGVTEEQWAEAKKEYYKDPVDHIKEYMEFAWDKANNQRGLSAGRSISHMIAWLWLAGEDEELRAWVENTGDNYYHYGKPMLEKICDHFGVNWKELDNGERTNG